jgi:hypothetical protein
MLAAASKKLIAAPQYTETMAELLSRYGLKANMS